MAELRSSFLLESGMLRITASTAARRTTCLASLLDCSMATALKSAGRTFAALDRASSTLDRASGWMR